VRNALSKPHELALTPESTKWASRGVPEVLLDAYALRLRFRPIGGSGAWSNSLPVDFSPISKLTHALPRQAPNCTVTPCGERFPASACK